MVVVARAYQRLDLIVGRRRLAADDQGVHHVQRRQVAPERAIEVLRPPPEQRQLHGHRGGLLLQLALRQRVQVVGEGVHGGVAGAIAGRQPEAQLADGVQAGRSGLKHVMRLQQGVGLLADRRAIGGRRAGPGPAARRGPRQRLVQHTERSRAGGVRQPGGVGQVPSQLVGVQPHLGLLGDVVTDAVRQAAGDGRPLVRGDAQLLETDRARVGRVAQLRGHDEARPHRRHHKLPDALQRGRGAARGGDEVAVVQLLEKILDIMQEAQLHADVPAVRLQPDLLVVRTGSGQTHGLGEKGRDVSRGRERFQVAQEPLPLAPRVLQEQLQGDRQRGEKGGGLSLQPRPQVPPQHAHLERVEL